MSRRHRLRHVAPGIPTELLPAAVVGVRPTPAEEGRAFAIRNLAVHAEQEVEKFARAVRTSVDEDARAFFAAGEAVNRDIARTMRRMEREDA